MKPKSIKGNRSGLTFVEVLAATAISALLMTAVWGVLDGISKQAKKLRSYQHISDPLERFLQQLEWDLANSEFIFPRENGFTLRGHAGRNARTGVPEHRRVRLDYAFLTTSRHNWLVRTSTPEPAANNQDWQRDLLSGTIAAIELQRIDRLGNPQPIRYSKDAQQTWIPIANEVIVRLTVQDGQTLERTLILR